jgi:hypothetical protein
MLVLSPVNQSGIAKTLHHKSSEEAHAVRLRDKLSHQPAITMAAPLYARYIPPKGPKPTQVSPKEPVTSTQPNSDDLNKLDPHFKKTASNGAEKGPKKKRKAEEIELAPEDHNESLPSKKHEAVFAKFNKSSRISERLKKNLDLVKEEATQEDTEPTLEVHGLCFSSVDHCTSCL